MSCDDPLEDAVLPTGFCASRVPVSVDQARGILSIGRSDFLVIERGTSSVVLMNDTDGDGLADEEVVVAAASGLNHGLAVHVGYLYASSATTVYRWPFDPAAPAPVSSDEVEVVVQNMNADGQGGAPFGHLTRTLAFDSLGRLYVSIGSAGNVDPDSFRSRIRRFDWHAVNGTDNLSLPIEFVDGEVFADGLRNEVGLAFDKYGVLWGVENGADRLQRSDLGGDDLFQDNPAEELNRFPEEDVGKHWGYPYCWTEYSIPDSQRGTIWAWPSFMNDGVHDDFWCRENTMPSVLSMQAHSAPLGIAFYKWIETRDSMCSGGAFPKEMDGYAFIAFHGSWNRDIPTGYKVVYVQMNETGLPVGEPMDLLAHIPPDARWSDGFRPVDVDFDDCGRLILSSDGSRNDGYQGSKIVRVVYNSSTPTTPSESSPAILGSGVMSLSAAPSVSSVSSASVHPSYLQDLQEVDNETGYGTVDPAQNILNSSSDARCIGTQPLTFITVCFLAIYLAARSCFSI